MVRDALVSINMDNFASMFRRIIEIILTNLCVCLAAN